MDIAGVIGDGAWAVVRNVLILGVFALIAVGAIRLWIADEKREEEKAFDEGRAIRLANGRVRTFPTFERRQKYEAGLHNERLDLWYDDQAQKDAHESGNLVLHDGKLLTPEQKVREERRLEEMRRREEERANRPKRRRLSSQEYAAVVDVLYKKQQGRCLACRRRLAKTEMEVDHKVPVADGGTDEIRNLQLLCGNCNRSKGTRSNSEFLREARQRQRPRRR